MPPAPTTRRSSPRSLAPVTLELTEWSRSSPDSDATLRGLSFDECPELRPVAAALTRAGRLEVTERRDGLAVTTTSWVGRVELGPIIVAVRPKIRGLPLLSLLRYAYGLRDLRLFDELQTPVTDLGFEELLIHQLVGEVEELVRRGLARQYLPIEADLASPIGRIDVHRIARRGGIREARLPCRPFPRRTDFALNRLLLAGLNTSARRTGDLALQRRARRLSGALANQGVNVGRLDHDLLREARRVRSRLTAAYQPAIRIVELLLRDRGTTISDEELAEEGVRTSGFLFDMNSFFQSLLSRLLNENARGVEIQDERRLTRVLAFEPGHKRRGRREPAPRPDFAAICRGVVTTYLDAKYRDVWSHSCPAKWLYQLGIYALGCSHRLAILLYATVDAAAHDERMVVRDPHAGSHRGTVVLRPVDLNRVSKAVMSQSPEAQAVRRELVKSLLQDASPTRTR